MFSHSVEIHYTFKKCATPRGARHIFKKQRQDPAVAMVIPPPTPRAGRGKTPGQFNKICPLPPLLQTHLKMEKVINEACTHISTRQATPGLQINVYCSCQTLDPFERSPPSPWRKRISLAGVSSVVLILWTGSSVFNWLIQLICFDQQTLLSKWLP